MNETKKMQRLHQRRACGEILSAEEQKALENWYKILDREEEIQINSRNRSVDIVGLRNELSKTLAQIAAVRREIEATAAQNEVLRRQNQQLEKQIETRLAEQLHTNEIENKLIDITEPVSPQQIIHAVQTMPLNELEQLIEKVLKVQTVRGASKVSVDENRLLEIVARRLPADTQIRMRELQHLRDHEQLSSEGYAELAKLIDGLEELHAERMTALATLANARGITLEEAMKQVGLNLPDHE